MSPEPQPRPKGYLYGVLADGATPFRHRGDGRTLLDIPDSETAVAMTAIAGPPLELNYAARHGVAALDESAPSLAGEWVGSIPETMPGPISARSLDGAVPRPPPERPGVHPDPVIPRALKTRPAAVERAAPEEPARRNQITEPIADPIREGAVAAVTPPAGETSTPAEPPATITIAEIITIPEIAERRARALVPALPNRVQPQPEALQMAPQVAGASPVFSESKPAAGVSLVRPGGPSPQNDSPTPAYVPGTGRRVASSITHAEADPTRAGDPEAGMPAVAMPGPAADVRPIAAAEQLGPTFRALTPSKAAAQPPAGGSDETASSPAEPRFPVAAARPVVRLGSATPIEPFRPDSSAPAALITPIALVAPTGVGGTGSADPPARGTAEQIAQLQRTVSDLASQIAAWPAGPPINPAPQPAVMIERPMPPARTPRAFWERSYLSRLGRRRG